MRTIIFTVILFCLTPIVKAQHKKTEPAFKVIAFYTAKNDQAHISFVHEANRWFARKQSNIILCMIRRTTGVS